MKNEIKILFPHRPLAFLSGKGAILIYQPQESKYETPGTEQIFNGTPFLLFAALLVPTPFRQSSSIRVILTQINRAFPAHIRMQSARAIFRYFGQGIECRICT
ncbi:MAG: hypothetical protein V8T87_08320 [Victivallales bacterium]